MYGRFFVLFALMLTGYILRKKNILTDAVVDGLNKFIIYFSLPCLLLSNMGNLKIGASRLQEFAIMIGVTGIIYVLSALIARLYMKISKTPDEQSNVAEFSMTSPNDGFIGFPVSYIFYGAQGLFLMTAHNVVLNLYMFSYGLICLRRNNKNAPRASLASLASRLIKVLLNPNLVAIYIGLLINLFHLSLDNPVGDYLKYMGDVTIPMAMVCIGCTLVSVDLKGLFKRKLVWGSSIVKLIILPVVAWILVWFLPIPPLLKAVLILGTSFPTAATTTMLCQQEKQDYRLSSQILFLSTLLSMATIPIFVRGANIMFL